MRTAKVFWILIAAALPAIVGCDEGGPGPEDLSAASHGNAESPPIRLLDLDGKAADLWQDDTAKSKVVVVVFTRSDCPISNRYAPDVRELCERFEPQGVFFYLIYVDPRETPDAIRAHLAEYAYPCLALRDPRQSLAAETGATVTPEAVVFDRQRNVVYRGRIDDLYADLGKVRSAPTRHDLADAIEATLAGRRVAEPVTAAVGCKIEDLK